MTKWIPVKEALPDNDHCVLVHTITRDGSFIEIGYCQHEDWYSQNGILIKAYVSHWVPLPKKPKKIVV